MTLSIHSIKMGPNAHFKSSMNLAWNQDYYILSWVEGQQICWRFLNPNNDNQIHNKIYL